MDNKNEVLIYRNKDGEVIVDAIYKDETLWLTDINNDRELAKSSTISKMKIVQKEGNRDVKRIVEI